MPTTSLYNHTPKLVANKEINLGTLKVMLLDATAAFVPTQTAISDISGDEVSGNGWPAGGPTIADVTVTVTETDDAMIDGADVSQMAAGGPIGPAGAAVIYDSTSGAPLVFIAFDEPESAGAGTPFNITWAANGFLLLQNAA